MNNNAPVRVAVVIPAYNEASTIADIASRTLAFTESVIVVNDASSDATAGILQSLPVIVLNNSTNMGKGESLCRGARHALGLDADVIITLDGDGQHRPEDIPLLLSKSARHPNRIVIAARLRDRRAAPPLRRFANRFADFWISWAAGYRIQDTQSGFRLYPAEVFRHCTTRRSGFVFESEILIDTAARGIFSIHVPIDTLYHNNARPSHYRPASDTAAIIKMVAWKLIRRGLHPVGLLRSLGMIRHA